MKYISILAVGLSFILASAPSYAQSPSSNNLPEKTRNPEPGNRGFTFTETISGTRDTVSGWSTVLESSVRYDFNRVFGMEVGVPYFLSHSGFDATKPVRVNTTPPLIDNFNVLGDAYAILHFAAPDTWFNYRSRIVGGFPSGDTSSGISTGRATFDFNNHFDHTWNFVTPYAELGIGDSSALINRLVKQPYTTLGPLSHFKAGVGFSFLKFFYAEGSGYESLPIGNQKVYARVTTIKRLKKQKIRVTRIVDTGQGLLEDNGWGLAAAVVPYRDLTFSIGYQNSLQQSIRTTILAVSYTFGRRKRSPGILSSVEALPE